MGGLRRSAYKERDQPSQIFSVPGLSHSDFNLRVLVWKVVPTPCTHARLPRTTYVYPPSLQFSSTFTCCHSRYENLPDVTELAALLANESAPSSLSLPFPFRLPSLAVSFCRGDRVGPPLVWGRGGKEAVRLRDMMSFSLLAFFAPGTESVGDVCCTSCEEEKRLKDLDSTAGVLLIAGEEGRLGVAYGVF